MQYSPAELERYLLDYKEGVEFQIYVDPNRSETQNPTRELDETRALPHAKVISIESDRPTPHRSADATPQKPKPYAH